jgi:hypothetical protein
MTQQEKLCSQQKLVKDKIKVGSLLGLIVAIGMIGSSWSGTLSFWGLPIFIVAALLGIFLMPMTVGTFMTSIMFGAPIAVLAGLIAGNSNSALTALAIGVGAFIVQFIIGKIRGGA